MKLIVIKSGYQYIVNNVEFGVMIDDKELESKFRQVLFYGDIWEKYAEGDDTEYYFKCISGRMKGEVSDGLFLIDGLEDYFQEITH